MTNSGWSTGIIDLNREELGSASGDNVLNFCKRKRERAQTIWFLWPGICLAFTMNWLQADVHLPQQGHDFWSKRTAFFDATDCCLVITREGKGFC